MKANRNPTGRTVSLLSFLLFIVNFAAAQTIVDSIHQNEKIIDSLFLKGSYQASLQFSLEHLGFVKDHLGEASQSYVSGLIKTAEILYENSRFAQSDSCVAKAIEICDKAGGIWVVEKIQALLFRIQTLAIHSQYDQAEAIFKESKELADQALPSGHSLFDHILFYEGYLHHHFRRYKDGETILKEAIVRFDTCTNCILNALHARHTLGGLLCNAGRNKEAIVVFKELLDICRKSLGDDHPVVGRTIRGLSFVNSRLGNVDIERESLLEAIPRLEKGYGHSSLYHYLGNFNLAWNYIHAGQWEKAEKLALKCLDIEKQLLGIHHDNYPMCLALVGNVYLQLGKLDQAEPYLLEAKNKRAEILSATHPHYAESLNALGRLYLAQGKWQQAQEMFEEQKVVHEAVQGPEHNDVADALMFLSQCHFLNKNYPEARRSADRSLEIYRHNYGNSHLLIVHNLNLLAAIYRYNHQYDDAYHYLSEAITMSEELLKRASGYASLSEMQALFHYYEKEVAFQQTQMLGAVNKGKFHFASLAFDNVMVHKGMLLRNSQEQLAAIFSAQDTVISGRYDQWKNYKRILAAEFAKLNRDSLKISSLEEEANLIEKELVKYVSNINKPEIPVRWNEIQNTLKPGEAAIEFTHFQVQTPVPIDSITYCALVLRSGWESPKMVYLCEQRQLDSLLNTDDTNAAVQILYTMRGKKSNRGITPGGQKLSTGLYRLLWQPLDSLLDGVTTVHYSPSGSLHRLAFDAIPTGKKEEVIADRYKLIQLFSTRSLVVKPVSSNTTATAALFGGINYEVNTTAQPVAENLPADSTDIAYQAPLSTRLIPETRSRRGEGWQYLPGTRQEVEKLDDLLEKNKISAVTFTGDAATEEQFKSLGTTGPSPAILHIATHGFFFPDPAHRKASLDFGGNTSIPLSEHPLMRSGLLLAGANKAWKEGKPFPGREDGILTAYEIAQVNLTGTKLAVLSACETGLGDIQGTEGVMGLQRAFKMAGVEKLIVSLWPVKDKESVVFMNLFYTKWLTEGMEIRDAFHETQKWMRNKYKDPEVWAGFVLVE